MAYHRGSTLVAQREYTYDILGRPTVRNTARQGAVVNDTFTHNTRSEPAAATVNCEDYAYLYDNIGNRVSAVEGEDSTVYTANALNQYTSIQENTDEAFQPEFDADGNQTRIKTASGIWTAVYNAENRPVSFTNKESGTVVECAYDTMGRRSFKKVTVDGTIVFPAQIWERGANPQCMSTICYSKDGGKNWVYGNGVPHSTSECQVVELNDGSIMINCRNEARQGKRIVYVTKDLGKTWQPHSTNLKDLQEPTCQGSVVKVNTKKYGELMLFSNPKSGGRNHMTIRTSKDDGKTWNEGYMYDVRQCMGYSCIAMTDANHVGIFYETCHNNGKNGCRGIGFIRIPLETVVTGKEVPAKPAKIRKKK